MKTLVTNLQVNHVPSELLSYNKLGELFYKLRIVKVVPNHSSRYKQSYDVPENQDPGPFQKRREISGSLLTTGDKHKLMQAAEDNLELQKIKENTIHLSVTTEKDNIDGKHGILTNYTKHGKNWERLAYVSVRKGDENLVNSAVGFRLHGGTSRDPNLPNHSYRLYFRKKYGLQFFNTKEIFQNTYELRTLVVHNVIPEDWPLNNVIANDLYRMAGVPTLDYAAVNFILNGENKGLYWISPHLSEKYLRKRFELNKIHYHRYRGDGRNLTFRGDIGQFVFSDKKLLDHNVVSEVLDLDGLINFFIAVTYSGNTDWAQGVAFKDAENDKSIWQWVAWDLDHSFIDWFAALSSNPAREVWRQGGLDIILSGNIKDLGGRRQILFRRLLNEDPTFKDVIVDRYITMLNHELSREKCIKLYEKYALLLALYNTEMNPLLLEFFENRHAFIREELQYHFNVPPFREVIVEGAEGQSAYVDGYLEKLPYKGFYPNGSEISIKAAPDQNESGFWLIDGEKNKTKDLNFSVDKPYLVRYVTPE